MQARGWDELDVLFISGDAYVDHPAFGVPLLARLLEAEGLRVGIIAQPDWRNPDTFRVMGRPRLFAALSSGAMDSMVNHFTAARKIRRDDAYTPGGKAGARPNRAVIAYTAALKGAFRGLPIVIGGIEASLRRFAHYDYWDDKVRRSILIDSKADLLIYGMGEASLKEVVRRLQCGTPFSALTDIPGTAHLASDLPEKVTILPSFEEIVQNCTAYAKAFRLCTEQQHLPLTGPTLAQRHGNRYVVVAPPSPPLEQEELDAIYALPFTRQPHPTYRERIPAYEQIRFSLTTHRGCAGGCAFCAIGHHQGKRIQSRSISSILGEIKRLGQHPDFRGTLTDLGGPTANMFGVRCRRPDRECRRNSCLTPSPCPHFDPSDRLGVDLLRQVRTQKGVKHAVIASGIRTDLLQQQPDYFADLLAHHVGGLLKVAPETIDAGVAAIMHKPNADSFIAFLDAFRKACDRLGLRRAVVPYFMSAHPGTTVESMIEVALFLKRHHLKVEQVQEFTPTPGSLSTCIYHTGIDPFTGQKIHIPRSPAERRQQKALLLWHLPESRPDILAALQRCHRTEVADQLWGGGSKGREKQNSSPRKGRGEKKGRRSPPKR